MEKEDRSSRTPNLTAGDATDTSNLDFRDPNLVGKEPERKPGIQADGHNISAVEERTSFQLPELSREKMFGCSNDFLGSTNRTTQTANGSLEGSSAEHQ